MFNPIKQMLLITHSAQHRRQLTLMCQLFARVQTAITLAMSSFAPSMLRVLFRWALQMLKIPEVAQDKRPPPHRNLLILLGPRCGATNMSAI